MPRSSTSFKKGVSGNPAGLTKSTSKAATNEAAEIVGSLLLLGQDKFVKEFCDLEGKDYVSAYIELLGIHASFANLAASKKSIKKIAEEISSIAKQNEETC